MSIVINLEPGVETILLSKSFTVRRSTVRVPQSLGWSMRLPLKVSRVRYGSGFPGR